MRDGMAKQMATAMFYNNQQTMQFLSERLGPLFQDNATRQADAQKAAFYNKFAELKGHERLVDMVTENLINSGFKAKTIDEVYTKVADIVRETLGPNAPQKQTPAPVKKPAGTNGQIKATPAQPAATPRQPTMKPLSGGGQGGTIGSTSATSGEVSLGHSVFTRGR